MGGLQENVVRLSPHDPRWAELFAAEAGGLRSALGGLAMGVEHIGSTAVEGLAAKPIIDIAVKTRSFADLPRVVEAMKGAGYHHKGEFGLPGRHFFTRGNPVLFHVHVVEEGSDHWSYWIKFRDALRRDPALRDEYIALKQSLAKKFANDRPGDTMAKSEFVARFLANH